MSNIKETKDGLVEKSSGRKIISPSDVFSNSIQHNKQMFECTVGKIKEFTDLLESNGYELDIRKKLTISGNSIDATIRFPKFVLEEYGKDK